MEVSILRRWLRMHESEYDSIDFNLRLGPGFDPGPTWPGSARQNALQNSQLRVDAVAWRSGRPTLIEVKDRAGATALGEVLAYTTLWSGTFPASPPPSPLIVTNTIQSNYDVAYGLLGIPVEVV